MASRTIEYTNAWDDEFHVVENVASQQVSTPVTEKKSVVERRELVELSECTGEDPVMVKQEEEEFDLPEEDGDFRDDGDYDYPDDKYIAKAFATGFGSKHTSKSAFHCAIAEDREENYHLKQAERNYFSRKQGAANNMWFRKKYEQPAMSFEQYCELQKNIRLVDLEVAKRYRDIGLITGRSPGYERGGRFEHLYRSIGQEGRYVESQRLEHATRSKESKEEIIKMLMMKTGMNRLFVEMTILPFMDDKVKA